MQISIIIPVYNEFENIAALHAEVKTVCEDNDYDYEIIIVDDGSTDNTFEVATALSPVKVIQFRKNFGQTAAMDAGIKNAKYEYIVTMDGDRQNDPADIPMLIDHLTKNGLDIVSGWRRDRKDNFLKRFVSRSANFLRKLIINDGIHDSGCSLKIYRRSCFENLSLHGEMHRFIPALLKIKGYKVGEIVVNHRPRSAGQTKYTWSRTFKGFIDMLTVWFWKKYATRPLHFLGGVGLFFILLGFLSGIATVYFFTQGQGMSETAFPMLTMFLFLSGIQLFISGLMIDILVKSRIETTGDNSYTIKEIVETTGDDSYAIR